MSKEELNKITENVMNKIKNKKIKMKPKWYFILGSFFFALSIFGLYVLSIFLISLSVFSARSHGKIWSMKYQQMIDSFPWWAIILIILGSVLGIFLLKKYDFSYKKNYPYIIFIFIFSMVLSGMTVNYFGIDQIWMNKNFAQKIYKKYDGGILNKGKDIRGLKINENGLSEEAKEALLLALNDEYKAFSTYEKIIEKFGDIKPFSNIIRAEENHIMSLISVFERYKIAIPENTHKNNIEIPETISESCGIGVLAEKENVLLYKEKLLPVVKEYEDITFVFNNLMTASETKHLPAFLRCQ